jgi:hypothetical protein
VRGVSTGAGPGIEGLATVGGGNGVKGAGDGSAAGVIGLGDTVGTGPGGEFTGGGTGGVGVIGKAQASVFGVSGISSGTNGGAGSGGVSGTATRNDSVGVAGFALIAGANPLVDTTPAVLGSAFDATAVYGKSTNGYGVWAESTGVIRASLHVAPQANDPIAPLEGDVWYNAAEDKLKGRISSFNMGLWSTRRGYTYAIEGQVGSINTLSTTFQTVITASFTTQTEPIIGSVLTFSVIFEMGCSVIGGSGAEEFEWQVLDVTDGVATPIPPRLEVSHVASTFADERYVTAKASYTVSAAGAQSFALEVRSINPVPAVRIRRAVMEITGSHG